MTRNEMLSLKLQMGIDPSVKIEPGVLRAMWQQLTLESVVNLQRSHTSAAPQPVPVTTNPMVV